MEGKLGTQMTKVWIFYVFSRRKPTLRTNLIREICLYLNSLLFPVIFTNKILIFDPETQKSIEKPLILDLFGTSIVILTGNCAFCMGKSPPSASVFTINLTSLQISHLAPLNAPREAPGAFLAAEPGSSGVIFAFGGYSESWEPLKTCEKYSLKARKWSNIANMRYARCWFTPTKHQSWLYLACTMVKKTGIERFDVSSELFSEVKVDYPQNLVLECASVSFVYQDELIILTFYKQMAAWKIDTEVNFRVLPTFQPFWSAQKPLIMDSTVFIPNQFSQIIDEFSLEQHFFV